ncbi:MAG: DUF697 domain-containing protein [Bacteroidia bacterium]|nr:DUF697 domain-containing protein [Bacteroidia bacterium]
MEEGKKIKDPRTAHSNSIIKNHMIWSMGAGFIPVPVADFFAVSAIQLDMIRQLSKIYEINFKETEGKAVISALTGSGIARIGARAIKFIPGIGSVLGGVTLAVLSGASTYALGEVFKKHFETGGTFLDFDPSRLKKYYDEKFEKGKQMAKDMEKSQRKNHEEAESVSDEAKAIVLDENEDVIGKLKELNELKKDGVITEEEFEKLKKDLIA